MLKILTIIGARPQFIKASVVSKAIQSGGELKEVILHTGQHFDKNMSDVFFDQLGLPTPDYQLNIHGGAHGQMTGRMLAEIEQVLISEKPDRVLVYGDTNSTLAGALAACKLHIPVAHIEAGLRSYNRKMPEELNRVLTDQISDILFCPTIGAVNNLSAEGFMTRPDVDVLMPGDVMQDSAMLFGSMAGEFVIPELHGRFVLATLHRAENTDDIVRLQSIVRALNRIDVEVATVVMPLHPRTKHVLEANGIDLKVKTIEPVGYFEMLDLVRRSDLILTDSGGLQKEAFFFGKACVTLRDETEWTELIDCGANVLAGADEQKIVSAASENIGRSVEDTQKLYGGGYASQRIAERLSK